MLIENYFSKMNEVKQDSFFFLLATKLTQIEFRDESFTIGSWHFISNAEHVIFQKKIKYLLSKIEKLEGDGVNEYKI